MKNLQLSITFVAVFAITISINAQTTGFAQDTIWEDTTWEDDTIKVTGDLVIADDVTLTIAEGTHVKFQGYYGIEVLGTINAEGSEENGIMFTVQDTNDFSDPGTTQGGWYGFIFDNSSTGANGEMHDNGYSRFDNCIFKYGKRLTESPRKDSMAFIFISTYSGLEIKNCEFSNCISNGFLIHINFSSSWIESNLITECTADAMLGIVNPSFDQTYISYNTISNNQGSGIKVHYSSPVIDNNLIVNNSKPLESGNQGGAGIYLNKANPWIFNNTICNNSTDGYGGGLYSDQAEPQLQNNIIWGNEGLEGDQLYIATSENISPDIYHCLIEGDSAGFEGKRFTGIYESNLSDDPIFLNPSAGAGQDFDGLSADWRLQDNSPCVNTGRQFHDFDYYPWYDIAGHIRIWYGSPDIGAYEFRREYMIAAGTYSSDSTWMADTIKVTDDITINNGVTIRIAAGAVVEMQDQYGFLVYGALHAEGSVQKYISADAMILFTAADTSFFHEPDSSRGGWNGIQFPQTSEKNDSSIFRNCIFEYGKRPQESGGAIYVNGFSKVRVSDCEFRYNMASNGGGMFVDNTDIKIEKSTFQRNHALNSGGGLATNNSHSFLEGLNISNNTCEGNGGGLFVGSSTNYLEPVIHNCLIYNNLADQGGGIYCGSTTALFFNNTISRNRSIMDGGGFYCQKGMPAILNTILWENISDSTNNHQIATDGQASLWIIYSNIQGGLEGINCGDGYEENNLDMDPEFWAPSDTYGPTEEEVYSDWYVFDYSPCVDAGMPDIEEYPEIPVTDRDFYDYPRIHNEIIDIGAAENAGEMPEIWEQPQNQIRCEYESFYLYASAAWDCYAQWFKDGEAIEGATDIWLDFDTLQVSDQGNYVCKFSNAYGSVESHPAYVLVTEKPEFFNKEYTIWAEPGKTIKMDPYFKGTNSDFSWEKDGKKIPGEILPELEIMLMDSTYEGNYKSIISNTCGSDSSGTYSIYLAPQICMVTVSPTTGHNLVIWEKKTKVPIMAYNIYRESVAAGIYDRMATISYDDLSVFVDTTADPTAQAYLYKITAIDTAENETDIDLCNPHKTIHLIVSTNPELNTTQLQWDRYYGFDYQTYTIYRSSTGVNFDPVHSMSASLNSWTDPNPSTGDHFYRIAVEKPVACVPEGSGKKAGTGPYQHTLSNMDDNKLKEGQLPPDTITISSNSIEEINLPGALIGKFFTEDKDTVDSHSYKFASGDGDDDNISFSILSDMLLASESFDYETKSQYKIRVRSTDEAGNYCEVPFIIQIIDIDETTGLPGICTGNIIAFPNPFSMLTTVTFPNHAQEAYVMILTDLSGKVFRIVDGITTSDYILKRGDLKKGLYFIELRGPKIYRGKIVIE